MEKVKTLCIMTLIMMMSLTLNCNMIVDRKDYVRYLTTTFGYSDECTCSLPEQNKAFNDLHYGF